MVSFDYSIHLNNHPSDFHHPGKFPRAPFQSVPSRSPREPLLKFNTQEKLCMYLVILKSIGRCKTHSVLPLQVHFPKGNPVSRPVGPFQRLLGMFLFSHRPGLISYMLCSCFFTPKYLGGEVSIAAPTDRLLSFLRFRSLPFRPGLSWMELEISQ